MQHKQLFLLVPLSLMLMATKCKTTAPKVDCSAVMCTMEYRMINVVLKDKSGNFYKADKVETHTELGAIIHSQSEPNSLPETSFILIEDGNLKDLQKHTNTNVNFKIYKDNKVVKTVKYVVTADCCHVSKVSGDDVIVVE